MSAKKSWDIQPVKVRKSATGKKPVRLTAKPVTGNMPLRARRRRARNRFLLIILFVLALLIGCVVYGLYRPEVRITHIETTGTHQAEIQKIALAALSGTYWGLAPRDSIFFYPEDDVRAALLNAFPDISALSISRNGFSSLSVSASARVTTFSWCGVMLGDGLASCYDADGEGFIFGVSSNASTSLRIYAPLKEGQTEPVGSTVEAVNRVPLALQFIRTIEGLGAAIESLQLRGDEADLFVRGSNTRITYVLGEEMKAAGLAATVIPTLSLTDGSIEYLDLRFADKAYVKKKTSEPEAPTE